MQSLTVRRTGCVVLACIVSGIAASTSQTSTGVSSDGPPPCIEQPPINHLPPNATLSADGASVSTFPGDWDDCGSEATFTYSWVRMSTSFVIPDETDATHTVTGADAGLQLRAVVTATNVWGSRSAVSNAVAIAPPAGTCTPYAAPTNIAQAVISGSAHATEPVTTSNGIWTSCGSEIAGYTYQWLRNGAVITGATRQSYVLTTADVGQNVAASVTAWNGTGASAPVASTTVVPGSEPAPDPPPAYGPPPSFTSVDCFGAVDEESCAVAASPPNFGGKLLRRDSELDVRGVRAGIQTPTRDDFYLPHGNGAVMRVSAENGPYLVQSGFGRSPELPVGACGTSPDDGKLYTYYESIAPGMGGNPGVQQCEWLTPVARATSNLHTVYRKLSSAVGNDKTWQVNINGVAKHLRYIAVDGMRIAVAGGEIRNNSPQYFVHGDGTVYGCYGCSATPLGVWNWQRTSIAGSSGWQDIADADDITAANVQGKSDDRWEVSPLPGPFYVLHRCKTDHSLGC